MKDKKSIPEFTSSFQPLFSGHKLTQIKKPAHLRLRINLSNVESSIQGDETQLTTNNLKPITYNS